MKTKELRKKYKDLRISLGLTMRDAAKLLKVSPTELSRIEVGVLPKLKVDLSKVITAVCHSCEEEFYTNPIKGDAIFPSYICNGCSLKGDKI